MSFLGEIKRRKVFQVAAAYAVVAWVLIEIVATIEEPLKLPDWVDTLIIVLLAFGFPIALIISWAFNLTPEGLVREPGQSESPQNHNNADVVRRSESTSDPDRISDTRKVANEGQRTIDAKRENKAAQNVDDIDKTEQTDHVDLLKRVDSVTPSPIPDRPSIAVLPFQTLAGGPDQEYLADGVVEAITAGLSCIRSFFVIARNSAFTFKNRTANAVDIGKELGVAYLLEGSVQHAGERIRITVQLIETRAGAHIWAKHYDGTIDDVFDLQDRITEKVAGELQPSIRFAEIERSRRKRPQDQSAYDFTMRAMRHVWALDRGECEKALDLLDKALAIEPDYPLALSLAGWCRAQRAVYNWAEDIAGSHAQAQKLAERAATLSGDDPMILTVLGTVHTMVRKFGTARVLLERAVTLDPNAAWAWQRLGWLETYLDHPEQALEHFARALRLSPLDPMNFNVHAGMGSAYEVAKNYDEAVLQYQRALEEQPHAEWIFRHLASALSGANRMVEAKQAYTEMTKRYPNLTAAKVREAMVYSDSMVDQVITNLKALGLPD